MQQQASEYSFVEMRPTPCHTDLDSDGMLMDEAGHLIFKPCTDDEIAFYETCCSSHHELLEHIPAFIGTMSRSTPEQKSALLNQDPMSISATLQYQEGSAEAAVLAERDAPAESLDGHGQQRSRAIHGKRLDTSKYLVLENIAGNYKKPNVLDIKLGARLWADDAPTEKRARLNKVAEETTSKELGFRVAGMRTWNPAKNQYEIFDKWYGRRLTTDTVGDAIQSFLKMEEDLTLTAAERRQIITQRFCEDLEDMLRILERLEIRMYSSSVLFVYEGDADALEAALEQETALMEKYAEDHNGSETNDADGADDDDDEEPTQPGVCTVKLIDFAHAAWTPNQGPDLNVLQGFKNVLKILKQQ